MSDRGKKKKQTSVVDRGDEEGDMLGDAEKNSHQSKRHREVGDEEEKSQQSSKRDDFLLTEVTEEWLVDTFKGVIRGDNVKDIHSKLKTIDYGLTVGGLIQLGLAEATHGALKTADVPFVARLAIERFANEGKREKKKLPFYDGKVSPNEEELTDVSTSPHAIK